MRVLVCGWFSFTHGEATAGDVLSLETVREELVRLGVVHDVAWSPVMSPPGGLLLEQADPDDYTHVVFACGPVHGPQVRWLHERFAGARRIAVGVSVIDTADPAATGFDVLLPRDAPGQDPLVDLGARPRPAGVPVVGVFLAEGQGEYGRRRRHASVSDTLTTWLNDVDAARLPLETRLDPRDWRLADSTAQTESVVRRLDVVVTSRLHGLVLALKNGVPALAVDPVAGGGKVTDQATAWGWPALVPAERVSAEVLQEHLTWCLSPAGGTAASRCAARTRGAEELVERLRDVLAADGHVVGAPDRRGGAAGR